MTKPAKQWNEPLLSETLSLTPSRVQSRSPQRERTPIQFITDETPLSTKVNSNNNTTRLHPHFTSSNEFGLSPNNEISTFSPRSDRSKGRGTSCASSEGTSSTESSTQRRLTSVKMKVSLAEAIVRNAEMNAKIPMPPEERKRSMINLEIAKLIVFVGRQFNIREELQQVMGCALEESEGISYRRRSPSNDLPFLAKEAPPDLSLEELRRVAADLEIKLEEEKKKRGGDAGKKQTISADTVTSNLSEVLWLIESVNLAMPSSMYADLDDEVVPDVSVTLAATEKQRKLQKEQEELIQQQNKKNESVLNTTVMSSMVPSGKLTSLSSTLADLNSTNVTLLPSKFGNSEGSNSSMEEQEELIGFSVDNESPGCNDAEAAGLKLLQFMYDAIAPDSDDNKNEEQFTRHNSEFDLMASTKGSTLTRTQRNAMQNSVSTRNQTFTESRGFNSSMAHENSCECEEEGEEEERNSLSDNNINQESNSSFSTHVSTGISSPSFISNMRPAPPTVQVRPMRADLIDILRKLYDNFNYNYYFQQCRPPKKSVLQNSGEDYVAEIERRVAQQKNEKRLKEEVEKNDPDNEVFSTWAEQGSTSLGNTVNKRNSSIKTRSSIIKDLSKNESPVITEIVQPPPPPLTEEVEKPINELASPTETTEIHDETILLSVELGEGLLFVLKGRKEKSSDSTSLQAKNGTIGGKKGNKKENGKINGLGKTAARQNSKSGELPIYDFDDFVLYAMNQTNNPINAIVNIDDKKLRNLRSKALLGYTIQKGSILINLPSNSAQSVLTLKPIKKGRRVLFDDALTFEECTEMNENKEIKDNQEKKSSHQQVKSTGLSPVSPARTTSISESPIDQKESVEEIINAADESENNNNDNNNTNNEAANKGTTETRRASSRRTTENISAASAFAQISKAAGKLDEDNDNDTEFFDTTRKREKSASSARKSLKLPFAGNIGHEMGSDMDETEGDEKYDDDDDDDDVLSYASGPPSDINQWNITLINAEKEKARKESKSDRSNRRSNAENAPLSRRPTQKGSENETFIKAEDEIKEEKPVDKWGVPTSTPDDEAFEKNCVVLSVLQASEWRKESKQQQQEQQQKEEEQLKQKEEKEKEKTDKEVKRTSMTTPASAPDDLSKEVLDAAAEDALIDNILNKSSSSTSPRYPSARQGNRKSAEEMVAAVLQRIAEEEELNPEDFQNNNSNNIQLSGESEDISVRVGSAALWGYQRPSQTQLGQGSFDSQNLIQRNERIPSVGTESKSIDETHKSHISSGSIKKQKDVETEKGSSHYLPSTRHSSSSSYYQLNSSSVGFKRSNGDFETASRATHIILDSRPLSDVGIGSTTLRPPIYCESCADHIHSTPELEDQKTSKDNEFLSIDVELGEKGIQQKVSEKGIQQKVSLQQIKGKNQQPKSERPSIHIDSLIKKITTAERKETTPELQIFPLTQLESQEVVLPPQQRPATPLRLNVYTENRPGGRVAVFTPQVVDTTKTDTLNNNNNNNTAGATTTLTWNDAEEFADGIRTNLHTCARRATVRSNQPPVPNYSNSTTVEKMISKRKSVDALRYASLPPISSVYVPDAIQEIEDVDAAEEEARELFLRDPARYDCVVDDLVRRAMEKVMEEEEEAERAKQASVKASISGWKMGEGISTLSTKLHTRSKSTPRESISLARSRKVNILDKTNENNEYNSEGKDIKHTPERRMTSRESVVVFPQYPPRKSTTQEVINNELERLMEEQWRAKKIVAYILVEMRRMWLRREMEANAALRAAVDRFIRRSTLFSWKVERRRVLNLRKLLSLLDRKTGRVRGWVPFYSKDNVVEDRFVWEPAPPHLSHSLRVVHRAMCLARQQRTMPIRIVRLQANRKKVASQHLLYGYKKTLVEPFMTPGVRWRNERRSRFVAPFQRPSKKYSPQTERMDGTPRIQF